MGEIPEQLRNEQFRFILINQNKTPLEKWEDKKLYYKFDNPELIKHLKYGGNCGILGEFGNLLLIDCDVPETEKTIDERLPATLKIRTTSGGAHFYFTCNNWTLGNKDGFDKDRKKIVEIKWHNKYLVAPNSSCFKKEPYEHELGHYIVEKDNFIAPVSMEQVLAALTDYLKIEPNNTKQRITIDESISEGNRNDACFRLACRFRKDNCSFTEALSFCETYNETKCIPPLSNSEVETCVKSAFNYNNEQATKREVKGYKDYFFNSNTDGTGENIAKIREDIWFTNEKGKSVLLRSVIADILMERYNFLTIGDDKMDIYYYENGIYIRGGEKIIGECMQRWTEGHVCNHDVNEVIGHIKRQTYHSREDLDNSSPYLICLKNGVYDILTKELLPHDPKYLFTQQVNCEYNPAQECPKFMNFLNEVLNPNDIPVVQEYLGFCFVRKYFIKKAMIFVGERDTGKTTLIKAIIELLGEKNISGQSLHKILVDKFAVANLYHKLLNFCDDLSFKDIKETGVFKIATGGGHVSAEKKFGECFEFKNYAKFLFATNKISCVEDSDDDAYYSRWLIVCFNNSFDGINKKPNPKLFDEITTPEELSGIFNWALKGLIRLLDKQEFSYKKTPEENKLLMERSSNTVSAFIQDLFVEQNDAWISKDDMYNLYSAYVNAFGGAKVTKEKFGRTLPLKAQYIVDGRMDCFTKEKVYGWRNIGFNKESFKEGLPFLPFFRSYIEKYGIIYNNEKNILGLYNSSVMEKKDRIDRTGQEIYTNLSCLWKQPLSYFDIEQLFYNNLTPAEQKDGSEELVLNFYEMFQQWKRDGWVFEPRSEMYLPTGSF